MRYFFYFVYFFKVCLPLNRFVSKSFAKAPSDVLNCISKFIAFVYRLDNIFNCRGAGEEEKEGHALRQTSWKQSAHTHTGKLQRGEESGEGRLSWNRQMGDSLTEMSNWQAKKKKRKQQRRVTKFK